MILEHALLPVRPGMHGDFEAAFAQAKPLIAGMPGFRGRTLSRCLEDPAGLEHGATYLLLVEWDALEDHTVGFRSSAGYQDWTKRAEFEDDVGRVVAGASWVSEWQYGAIRDALPVRWAWRTHGRTAERVAAAGAARPRGAGRRPADHAGTGSRLGRGPLRAAIYC